LTDADDPTDDDPDIALPGETPTVDAATQQGLKRQANRAKREFQEREAFWKAVLDDPVGRRELWRTIFGGNATHIAEARFPHGPAGFPDPNACWYARGQQDMGQQILAELSALYREGVWAMQDEYDRRFPKRPRSPRKRKSE
jgi:hypothetical protein